MLREKISSFFRAVVVGRANLESANLCMKGMFLYSQCANLSMLNLSICVMGCSLPFSSGGYQIRTFSQHTTIASEACTIVISRSNFSFINPTKIRVFTEPGISTSTFYILKCFVIWYKQFSTELSASFKFSFRSLYSRTDFFFSPNLVYLILLLAVALYFV